MVEYKGKDRMKDADMLEKNVVGELWERVMKGKGVFATVTEELRGRDMRAQILEAIA